MIQLAPDAVLGVVDVAERVGGTVELTGWAATRAYAPVRMVLVFAGGRLVGAGIPTLERPDVSEGRGVPATNLGFVVAVPRGAVRAKRGSLRVFGVTDGKAAPLRFDCPADVCGDGLVRNASRTPRHTWRHASASRGAPL